MTRPGWGETYLTDPGALGARLGDRTWGAETVVVGLPGGPYAFEGMTAAQAEAVATRWAGFVRPSATGAAVRTRMLAAASEAFRRFDLKGFELTVVGSHAPGHVDFAGYEIAARLDLDGEAPRGRVWTSAEDPATFAGVAENFFRALVAYRLLERGAVLLHSAAVVRRGAAYVFFGPSGVGKSTLSHACAAAGDVVISDDLNAIVPEGGRHVALALPFCGDVRSGSALPATPVAGLCRLRQAPADRAEPLSRAAAVAALTACAPYVNHDPYRSDALLRNLEGLAGGCPMWMLSFTRNSVPWPALEAAGVRP